MKWILHLLLLLWNLYHSFIAKNIPQQLICCSSFPLSLLHFAFWKCSHRHVQISRVRSIYQHYRVLFRGRILFGWFCLSIWRCLKLVVYIWKVEQHSDWNWDLWFWKQKWFRNSVKKSFLFLRQFLMCFLGTSQLWME